MIIHQVIDHTTKKYRIQLLEVLSGKDYGASCNMTYTFEIGDLEQSEFYNRVISVLKENNLIDMQEKQIQEIRKFIWSWEELWQKKNM